MLTRGAPCPASDAASIADRLLVREVIARNCWGYDERREVELAHYFTDDAVWEGNVLGRIRIGLFEGRARTMNSLTNFWP